jgi:multidrug efflux system outer membrane protein
VKLDASATAIPALAPAKTAKVQAIAIDRWWTLLGDEQLARLIEEALARNADLEVALGRVHEAQATLDVVRAAQFPTLDAKFGNSRSQLSEVGSTPVPPGFGRQVSSHKFTLEAGYDVDLWGRYSSSTKAARSQLLATEWARAAIEWSLTAGVAQTYYELAAIDRQIQVSQAVRASRARTVELRSRERSVGVGGEFDLRRAEAELTSTDATLASLARTRAALEHSLLSLTGRSPTEIATLELSRAVLDETRSTSAVLPQGTGAELLVRRPDVRQAEAQLAAANYNVDAARAAMLPSLRLTGSIGSDARSMADLFTGPAAIWSLGSSIAQPLIDGGRLKAQTRQERARAEQALASYRKVISGAVLDVREAYEALDLTEQAVQAQRARVVALERARVLAKLGYDNGAASYLDLLDAERNLYQAQLDQVSAYRDQLIGQVAAFKALGGGYATASIPTGSTL